MPSTAATAWRWGIYICITLAHDRVGLDRVLDKNAGKFEMFERDMKTGCLSSLQFQDTIQG